MSVSINSIALRRLRVFWKLLIILPCGGPAMGAGDPPVIEKPLDFTSGATLPKQASHDWTLGAIGARGWCQVDPGGAEGTTKSSRQILITGVDPNGPAKDLLKKGDVIVGLGSERFKNDARIAFAKSLNGAPGGIVALLRFREGNTETIQISISDRPPYSATAPFDCSKSASILDEGCDALSKRGLGKPSIPAHLNALALLASGDRKYDPILREFAMQTLSQPLDTGMPLSCWHFAFANLFLSEYYLATSDKQVLPEIQRMSKHLVDGQGPLGTWGHKSVDPMNHRLSGYGAVNAVGLPVAISLVLARECGIKVEGMDECIGRSADFFKRHVGLGAIPYGDGPPNLQYGHDDNGKNSAAAIFFNLLGDQEATRYYTRTALAAFGRDREQGHTGNFFNILWALPAVSIGGPEASGAWMKEFGWYYDLACDPRYRFPYQGYPRQAANNAHSDWDCPGAYLIQFALPRKALRITGKKAACIPPFTADEIKETIQAGHYLWGSIPSNELVKQLSSWSPQVRQIAVKQVRKGGAAALSGSGLKSSNPLERVAALKCGSSFESCEPFLADPDLRVRISALEELARLNRKRALAAVFSHLAKHPEDDPVFTQALANTFFPINAREKAIGDLLLSVPNRNEAGVAILRLLGDEDSLVASRVAMGLGSLPEAELTPMLPAIRLRANQVPEGNVMFGSKLRIACATVLVKAGYQEGMDAAATLMADTSWGKQNRLPFAAALLKGNASHAKDKLPELRSALPIYKSPGDAKWKALLQETIKVIEKAPTANKPLRSIPAR